MKKKKIGRNDPCPCGSGIKYKKCCRDKPRTKLSPKERLPVNDPFRALAQKQIAEELLKNLLSTIPKSKPKRVNHHYVPIWYQKRFIPNRQKILHYLNIDPFIELPDGRRVKGREIYKQGPRVCFKKKDLYTTRFYGIRNEDIEEFLFGEIDNYGPEAIHGLVSNDPRLLHKHFQNIYSYMDAQKLRTPKGLDWIRSNYFQLTNNELLLEMQHLRTMHCTMWVEGVMEIVSAEDSDIKFIISDHPVTVYNPACPPDSEICQYPNDPPIGWKASQTIFPLDLNHCFILTNLEYAREPEGVDPVVSRTNPRFFGQTLARWDIVIRKRKLEPKDVCAINYIIKKRARKYIASGNPEWLYPEKTFSRNEWGSLSNILLPPKNELYHFGGEVYVGGKDGKLAWYQDEFGRRHTSREEGDDSIRNLPIKERNEILINAMLDIFGFNEGKNWNDFRKELTDDKIKKFYGVIGGLWNPDTEITNFLPRPDDTLKAFYHGTLDPRIIPLTVIGYSLYVDKIILYSPFFNPRAMNEKHSPYNNPGQYRADTVKSVFMMLQLMPLVHSGIVEMIPDPAEFDSDFRLRIFDMAKARMKYRGVDKDEMGIAQRIMEADTKMSMLSLPTENLKNQFRRYAPDQSEEDLEKMVKYAEKVRLADPFASLQPMAVGDEGGQMHIFRMSGNHEMALYLSQVTGSFIYTDTSFCWKEYQLAKLKKLDEDDVDPWAPIVKALNEFNLIMYYDPDPRFWYQIKREGYLDDIIILIKNILTSVRTINDPEEATAQAKEYVERLTDIDLDDTFEKIEKEYINNFDADEKINLKHKCKLPANYLIPANGISSNTVTQILLTHGINTSYWKSVPFGAFLDLENSEQISDN